MRSRTSRLRGPHAVVKIHDALETQRETERQRVDRETERQIDRETDGQTDRKQRDNKPIVSRVFIVGHAQAAKHLGSSYPIPVSRETGRQRDRDWA